MAAIHVKKEADLARLGVKLDPADPTQAIPLGQAGSDREREEEPVPKERASSGAQSERAGHAGEAALGQESQVPPEAQKILRDLFPPLARHEVVPLRRLIEAGEVTPRVVVWAGKGVVVDGRETERICRELGVPVEAQERDFADIEDVIRWRIESQLGRRNLTPLAASYYRGKLYLSLKQQGRRSDLSACQSGEKRTDEQVGRLYGVGARTISRDAKLCEALDAIAEKQVEVLDPLFPDGFVLGTQYRSSVLSGKIRPTRGEILTMAKMRPGEMLRAIKDMLEAKKEPRRKKAAAEPTPDVRSPHEPPAAQDITPEPGEVPEQPVSLEGDAVTPAVSVPRPAVLPATTPTSPPVATSPAVSALTNRCEGIDGDTPDTKSEPEGDPETIDEAKLKGINGVWGGLNPATQLAFLTQDDVSKRICEAGFFRTVSRGLEGGGA